MNSKRLYWLLVSSLVVLTSGGIAAVVLGNKALQGKTAHLLSLKAESVALEDQQRSLTQAKKDIETYSELEKIVKTIVPQEKDQARTVREIVALAQESGVKLGTVSFPSSTLGQTRAGSSAPPASAANTPTTQVKQVEGIPGLYQMEVNVQSATPVSYARFMTFLQKLEQNRTTSQVRNITVQPITGTSNVTFNLTIYVYLKP